MAGVAGQISAGLVVLLLHQLYSWLPSGIGICVQAVFAAVFLAVAVKVINFIFGLFSGFVNVLLP